MPVNLLIAEDQRLFRQSLRLLLERERDIRVVGEAIDGRDAFEQAMKLKPDMILMDVDMPKLDGVTATKLIRGGLPDVKILMLSVHDEDARIVAAVQAGACGYILKDADHAEFLRIIRATHRGQPVHSPFMPDRFAKKALAARHESGSGQPDVGSLTEREREILAYVASGQGNKEIADHLGVSLDTVKTHLHHIYQKLRVTGRVEAILSYLKTS
jgi:DNA-binding NarL/FixJ family response regulator